MECKINYVRKTKRPYHHGDLRSALLEAAERALESGGSQELSLRELSRELGVSNTAPRRHFINKQALLDALALDGFERLGAALTRAIADKEDAFDARIVRLARAYARFAMKHSVLIGVMFAAKHHPEATPALLEASDKALSKIPLTIQEGQAAGAVVPGSAERLSMAVFASVEGLISVSTNGQFGGTPIDKLVVEVVDQIIVGLRPRS